MTGTTVYRACPIGRHTCEWTVSEASGERRVVSRCEWWRDGRCTYRASLGVEMTPAHLEHGPAWLPLAWVPGPAASMLSDGIAYGVAPDRHCRVPRDDQVLVAPWPSEPE